MTDTATTETGGSRDPRAVVDAFNDAWNAHDLEAVLALMADDCAYESAQPGAHGARLVGVDALRAAWAPGFAQPSDTFTFEDIFVAGDRVVQLWCYGEGPGAVRGVDVMRVDGGKITEKFGYVKVS